MIRTFLRAVLAGAGLLIGAAFGAAALLAAERAVQDWRRETRMPVSPLTGHPLDGEVRRG